MIVLFTEEPSMKATIEALMQKHFPHAVKGWDWLVIDYNGKSDLEKGFPARMRAWSFGNPRFVILRDADGGECLDIKHRLASLALPSGKPFKVRIVCQELESWFIGDSQAVGRAYPGCRFTNETAKYRNPDRLANASQELANLTGEHAKIPRAMGIAAHLDPTRNCSRSFQVFFSTLQELFA